MHYFCTFFDHNYLIRGLALYASLQRHCADFHLDILCLDEKCNRKLQELALPGCSLIALADIEAADPELLTQKAAKTIGEYSFTLKPCLVQFLWAKIPEGEIITYLDSDMYFFANPQPIFDEINNGSIGITPHRFPEHLEHLKGHGIYNSGWVSFRNDEQGRASNELWRKSCLEWCYEKAEGGRYGDQAYLNEWPSRFQGTVVIQNIGANVGPWNLGQYRVASSDSAATVDGQVLIFYHFHALRQVTDRVFDSQLFKYGIGPTQEIRKYIYEPYLDGLLAAQQKINGSGALNAQPAKQEHGFELIPRKSSPELGVSPEDEKIEEHLYRNLVKIETDRLAKHAHIVGQDALILGMVERDEIRTKWIKEELSKPLMTRVTQFGPRLAKDLKRKATARFLGSCGMRLGSLRQYEPKKMRPEKFPAPSQSADTWPSLCVVTPSFMQGHFLGRTMGSVISQNYPKLTYIVQDGGSKDNSVEVIKSYESRLSRWESAPDGGQADAIKRGFRGCKEDIMAWLNSDDMLMPGALALVGEYFAKNPSVDVVYGHRVIIDENDEEVGRWMMPRHDPEMLKWADYIPQETLFWRRKLWEKVEGVDISFQFAIDWDLLYRFQRAGANIIRLPYFLGCFRTHPTQKTSGEMTDSTGDREMARIRRTIHGRDISRTELSAHVQKLYIEAAKTAYLHSIGIRR